MEAGLIQKKSAAVVTAGGKSLAIVGAGPIGIEAAVRGLAGGWRVTVFERDVIGGNLLKWGHVRFFTSLIDNVSPALFKMIPGRPDPGAFLTGREFVETVLRPVANSLGVVREGTRVISIGRRRLQKVELPNHPLRAERPFQLLLRTSAGEEMFEADAVVDAGGVFGQPNWSGESGIPAPGEIQAGDVVERHLPDIGGTDRNKWKGKRVLVIGDGHSAATAIHWFGQLAKENPATRVYWVVPGDRSRPCSEVANDPLDERRRTVASANDLAQTPPAGWRTFRKSSLLGLKASGDAWEATVGRGENRETVTVDRVLSLTGYRPDTSYFEELQVGISPQTGGAAGLAKSLASITDCLSPVVVPPENLQSGESGFFMVGHKSYGRLNTFLLRSGIQQLGAIFDLLEKGVRT